MDRAERVFEKLAVNLGRYAKAIAKKVGKPLTGNNKAFAKQMGEAASKTKDMPKKLQKGSRKAQNKTRKAFIDELKNSK